MGRGGWFRGQRPVFRQTDVLGMGAELGAGSGKDLVTWLESPYVLANRFDFAGELRAQDRPPWSSETEDQPHQLVPPAKVAVGGRDGRGMDTDQDLVVAWGRRFQFFD